MKNCALCFRSKRRGIVLVTVILCLLVASAMLINLVKATTILSRQTSHHSQRLQLQILTDDAMSHALNQYHQQDSYTKETWEISPDQWSLKQNGRVVINVSKKNNTTIITVQGSIIQDKHTLQKLTQVIEVK